MVRVYLVDDRPLPRAALGALLTAVGAVEVAGEAAALAELADRLHGAHAGVVVAHHGALDADGRAPTRLVPHLVLIDVPRLMKASGFEGAAGWLGRDATVDDLHAAIAAVDAGHRHVAPGLDAPQVGEASLSRREFEVMRALAAGGTNREIARTLGISVKTIDTHRGHVLKKLGLRNNSDMTRYAIRCGFLRA